MALKATGDLSLDGDVLVLDRPAGRVTFHDVPQPPALSLLRGFSAPVRLEQNADAAELLALARLDSDPFNRWQALRTLMTRAIVAQVRGGGHDVKPADLAAAVDEAAASRHEPAYVAQLITLPAHSDIAREIGEDVDPDAVHAAVRGLARRLGRELRPRFESLHDALATDAPYSPDAGQAGARALRNVALAYLCHGDPQAGGARAEAQVAGARNMTDRLAGLSALGIAGGEPLERALAAFEAAWRGDPLVLDKWFALQATLPGRPTLERVKRLMRHPAFSLKTPNRVYALLSSFAHANPTEFHRPDGAGYAFVEDAVVTLDALNPQVASRLMSAYRTWRTLEPGRRALAEAAIRRISARSGLSRDVADIAERALR